MTLTHSEKRFYEAFDIPKFWYRKDNDYARYNSYNEMIKSWMDCNDWTRSEAIDWAKNIAYSAYLPITDHMLLELICIYISLPELEVFLTKPSIDEMKGDILYTLVDYCNQWIEISDEPYVESRVYTEVRKVMGVT